MKQSQRGLTLIGFVVVLCVVGFFAYCAMKLVPVYSEYMGVVKSMEQLAKEPGIGSRDVSEIRATLGLKFNVQYVDDTTIPPANIQVKKTGGATSVRVFYDKRVKFISNIDLLVSFDKTVNLGTGAGE
ncbi:uncharacterized protein DUF4845 [Tahibacter aquaticus]|uniref:Uncharacterized protein DUF4845 n=1 Tax=Tahibacter aquaticus TaxID=520092 RepID=A0A4R6YNW5_9GAMM|nr:DUF4845 domain-containing protein [Tahibacter aquaticus]TDR39389.1 uncharacterized protein DUF4845 [Tahibacter aquaticus]